MRIAGTLFLAGMFLFCAAQSGHSFTESYCKHEDNNLVQEMVAGYPNAHQDIAAANADLEVFTQQWIANNATESRGSNFVIPVVFHIIHNNGPENISDAQVRDAVRVMTRDFNLGNTDTSSVVSQFKPLIADIGIEFRLAQRDPNGNCTKGINRIQSPLTYQGDQDMKDLIIWPRDKYMNIWVCNDAAGAAGYTMYPGSVAGPWGLDTDGIVVRYDYTGSIGASSAFRSRTLTHEVGHWLNLRHLWGNSNSPNQTSNCNEDDLVNDTPNTVGWTSCNLNGTTCGSLDNVQNYMEYSYCSRMFTAGQKARMLAALNSNTADRNNLHQQANLVATGTDGSSVGLLCEAVMNANIETICAGDSVLFSDVSYNGVASRTWTFQGGTPATSTDSSVWVHFNSTGVFDVSLSASDGLTTDVDSRTGFITVLPNAGIAAPFSEDFETLAAVPNNDWLTKDHDNDGTWEVYNQAGAWSSSSVRLVNAASKDGYVDELISTSIDMSAASDIEITFRFAYAQRISTNDDKLRLYASKDCGQTWFLRKQLRGFTSLVTGSPTASVYVPGPDDFEISANSNFTPDFHVSDFRIKFEFESDGGNYVYLDDININGTPVGIAENDMGTFGQLSVFPNPATDIATLEFQGDEASDLMVVLLDPTGRMVKELFSGSIGVGNNTIPLDLSTVSDGYYLVHVSDGLTRRSIGIVKE